MASLPSGASDESSDSEESSPPPSESNAARGGPPLEATLRSLSDRRRRDVLYHLQDCSVVPVESVAEHLVDLERTRTAEADTVDKADVLTDLHHRHLPKLAHADLITYDRTGGMVGYDCSATAEELLEFTRSVDRPEDGTG